MPIDGFSSEYHDVPLMFRRDTVTEGQLFDALNHGPLLPMIPPVSAPSRSEESLRDELATMGIVVPVVEESDPDVAPVIVVETSLIRAVGGWLP